ncbi:MAG: hypothetical protein NTZ92_01040 [Candidatus Omnitrophica bacterium]|nr:hypothetical protein [Candidatus Omnitrophota bacterium]
MKLKPVLACIILLLFPIALFAAEPSSQEDVQAVSASRDGSSFEKAIIIKYIGDYYKSIEQEYQYLETKFGTGGKNWNLVKQSLKDKEGKAYDEMIVEVLPSKEIIILYFDITEPFAELNKQFSSTPK